ncbi:ABC transporter ATP-binding protein/permease [Thiocystis violacea]|uniref:ABC transporter ATP-binding protein/permease n=1 Tax=Thiocystis violacea TaxID=13725 RepID=UPI001903B469|nr:ABC transporter ATP-binding protein/permease [Thiocystis violacea]
MDKQHIPHKLTAARFVRAVHFFAASEVGWKARWMFAGLIAFLFAINGMNVVNSYVGRDFMTAIADRNQAEFVRQAAFYVGVFAASTLIAVSSRFTEERLALLWRNFMTGRILGVYLANGTYQRLEAEHALANPDQRITEDVRAFTTSTLSFVLMLLNSSFTVVAFSGVLWSISPLLFMVAVLYAASGSLLTILLGRPLVGLNYDQLDKEADFRAGLIHVRENAEAIRLARCEGRLEEGLRARLAALVGNFRRITSINRNLGFFTTGYNWLIQIIPALIITPAFIAGQVEFGVITQSAMAFSTLVAAFSLIVTQFQSISSFAAVVSRLSSLVEAVEQTETQAPSAIAVREEAGRLVYEGLTLRAPEGGQVLIRALSIAIPEGTRTLIRGADKAATLALLRATAGLPVSGEGILIRPPARDLLFLAERPYLPPGRLRAVLVPLGRDEAIPDARILGLLADWNLDSLPSRVGGLDSE